VFQNGNAENRSLNESRFSGVEKKSGRSEDSFKNLRIHSGIAKVFQRWATQSSCPYTI